MKLCPPGPDAHELSTVTAVTAQLKPTKLENFNYPSGFLALGLVFFSKW